MFLARHLLLLALISGLSGCNLTPDAGVDEPEKGTDGLFARMGKWLAEDPAAKKRAAEASKVPQLTQQLPIGSVHLVQEDARFVLIRSSRMTTVVPEAELLTYDAGGRPTGKLKISPERKSGFLTADIVEGRPRTGDRVVMFGQAAGADSSGTPGSGAPGEVLE